MWLSRSYQADEEDPDGAVLQHCLRLKPVVFVTQEKINKATFFFPGMLQETKPGISASA